MPWVLNLSIDTDKSNVGSATAVFTDGDGTTFTATARATLTSGNANSFASQSITARNAWQTRKTTEAADRTALVNAFTNAGESASASASGNSASVTINLAS